MAESPDPLTNGGSRRHRRRGKRPRNALQQRHAEQIAAMTEGAQRKRAVELRLTGATYQQIADELGIAYQTAVNTVNRALADAVEADKDKLEELRQLEIDRLDRLWATYFPRATQEEVWQEGRIIKQPNMAAANFCLKIAKRRAELVGLDKEQKTTLNVGSINVTGDQLAQVVAMTSDPEAARALERLAALWAHGEEAIDGEADELGAGPPLPADGANPVVDQSEDGDGADQDGDGDAGAEQDHQEQ